MNTDIIELDRQISAIFKTSENQKKYEKLIAERENLLEKQSNGEIERLESEIVELKNRQSNSGARRYQLIQAINEKRNVVKILEPEFETAQRELGAANLNLSFFEQSVSADRMRLYDLTKKLTALTNGKNDD